MLTLTPSFFGATVTSWKVDGQERLFLSKKAHLDGSAAIRGGIPIVFPIFGPPPSSPPEYAALKQHGFARTSVWKLEKVLLDNSDGVAVRFVSPPPPASFPHNIELHYVVTLAGHQLVSDLHVVNKSGESFKFQALLHSYIRVADASRVEITGIEAGTTYKDKVLGGKVEQTPLGPLLVDRELDRVYQKVPSREVRIDDATEKGGAVKVRFRGFQDTTIWNPGKESGSKMGDMEDGGWDHFVCVEPGFVSEWKEIKPEEQWIGQQVLTLA